MINLAEDLIAYVKQAGKRYGLVVVAADDVDLLKTVEEAVKYGVIVPTLVGPAAKIKKLAQDHSIDISSCLVMDKAGDADCIAEGIRLIREGHCDFIMKGAVRTGDLMKEMLHKESQLRTDRILSHVGVFTVPGENRLMLITDAGINIAPDLKRKRDIVLNAVDVAHALGLECPKVAVLSFIEKIENKDLHPAIRASTEDAEALTEMCKAGNIPGCIVEGPYALDNAISPYAAEKKKITGLVAGQADILVAHDINMGNAIYKSLQVWVQAVIAGVVVGCKTPVVVPSRNDSTESKLQSIGLAMLLMMKAGK